MMHIYTSNYTNKTLFLNSLTVNIMCLLLEMHFDILYTHLSHLVLIIRKVLSKYYNLYISLLHKLILINYLHIQQFSNNY
jgi:hypothetical protein